jgi:hypothetical protein
MPETPARRMLQICEQLLDIDKADDCVQRLVLESYFEGAMESSMLM